MAAATGDDVVSFPSPTTVCVDLAFFQRLVDFARENEVFLVHDFAYADVSFDGYVPHRSCRFRGRRRSPSSCTP